jgi:hypothetical protein
MSAEESIALEPRIQAAVDELEAMIQSRYPEASFDISASPEDPAAIHLHATVDVEDPDHVLDLVIGRVLDMQEEQGLPVHVIPLRPLARVIEELRTHPTSQRRARRPLRIDLPPTGSARP